MNGFGTKFACNTMLLCITNVSAAVVAVISPVQFEKTWPVAGLAVMVSVAPTFCIVPFKFGETVPLPVMLTVMGLTTTKVTALATLGDSLPLVSNARARIVFGPGINPLTVAVQVLVPLAS